MTDDFITIWKNLIFLVVIPNGFNLFSNFNFYYPFLILLVEKLIYKKKNLEYLYFIIIRMYYSRINKKITINRN